MKDSTGFASNPPRNLCTHVVLRLIDFVLTSSISIKQERKKKKERQKPLNVYNFCSFIKITLTLRFKEGNRIKYYVVTIEEVLFSFQNDFLST